MTSSGIRSGRAASGFFSAGLGEVDVRVLLAFLLCVGAAAAQCISMGFASVLLSCALIVVFVCSPLRLCLLEMYVSLPFFNVMNSAVGTTSLYYVLLGAFIIKALRSIELGDRRPRILAVIFVVLLTIQNGANPSFFVRWLLVFVPLLLAYGTAFLSDQLESIVTAYAVSSLVSSVFGMYLSEAGLMQLTDSYVYNDAYSNTMRFGGLVGDPVMYSETLVFLISCIVARMLEGRGSPLNLFLAIALAVPCALTYSKSALALLAFVAVFAVCYLVGHQLLNPRTTIIAVVVLAALVVSTVALYSYVASNPGSELVATFTKRFDATDLLTGRTELWADYFAWFREHGVLQQMFGVGFAEYNDHTIMFSGDVINRCHNIYLETLLLFGYVGLALVIAVFLLIFRSAVRSGVSSASFLPLIVLGAFGIVLHGHTESFYYFLLTIALAYISIFPSRAGKPHHDEGVVADDKGRRATIRGTRSL